MPSPSAIDEFIESSRHAIDHLFEALKEYRLALEASQQTLENVENAKQLLLDLFMYRDQWSPNANHFYGQYVERLQDLDVKAAETKLDPETRLANALLSVGATVASMSTLAGAVLQIAKQILALRHSGKPNLPSAKKIGSQPIVEVIWEGRNHAMHWDEGGPRPNVQNMLNTLSSDLRITIDTGKNNSLSILGALDWRSTDDVVADLKSLTR